MEQIFIPYLSKPVLIRGETALIYDLSITHPIKHFKLGADARKILSLIKLGRVTSPDRNLFNTLEKTQAIKILSLPKPKSRIDSAVIESSLGGPTIWANLIDDKIKPDMVASYQNRLVKINGDEIKLKDLEQRFIFAQIVRVLLWLLKPRKTMIIGREIAAKLVDFLPKTNSTILETGFAEQYLPTDQFSSRILENALDEILFRNYTYPWDNLSHSILAAHCIRIANLNLFWSKELSNLVSDKYPDANIRFYPPTIDINMFSQVRHKKNTFPIKILASMGKHTTGKHGVRFLSIRTLLAALRKNNNFKLSILSENPTRLQQELDYPNDITFLPRKPHDRMPDVFANHDVYYRVQNDASLPISCLEAMASGMVAIASDQVKKAYPFLHHRENIILTPYDDQYALESELSFLSQSPTVVSEIGKQAHQLTSTHCDVEEFLRSIDW